MTPFMCYFVGSFSGIIVCKSPKVIDLKEWFDDTLWSSFHRIHKTRGFPNDSRKLEEFSDNKHFIYISMLKSFGVLM